jgi:poly-gamma-glutamate capsule biosynthesis protein CapA/YwtB (metallophosphatase superfamily)
MQSILGHGRARQDADNNQAHPDARPWPARETTILVAADWAPIRAFEPLVRNDPEAAYGDMLPLLRSADLRIVNCECALTAARAPVWKSGAAFKGAPEHVRGLTAVPFDVACLANNHVFDYGAAGFRETLRVLRRSGIRTVGAGLTAAEACRPLTVTRNRTRISILNISEGEDLTAARGGPGVCGWDLARSVQSIRRRKRSGAFVLVVAHCGLEYVPYPPPYVRAAFRALVDAGADCVIGHHPHVPQGIEWHRGRPIAYSLGNFLFYQLTDLYYRKLGFCLSLKLAGDAPVRVELHPYRITEAGLRRLGAAEEKKFRQKMSLISRPLRTDSGAAHAWEAYLAYYGAAGFTGEVLGILERMKSEPQKGAAMFRNRITTLQHTELWRDFLTRMMEEGKRPYSREAYRLVEEWFTKKESEVRMKNKSARAGGQP